MIVSVSALRSRPARGGWIEISIRAGASGDGCTSRPARGGWIEIVEDLNYVGKPSRSRPARGGWIEILLKDLGLVVNGPAPHGAGGLK